MAKDSYLVFQGIASTSDTPLNSNGAAYSPGEGRMFVIKAAAFFNGNLANQSVHLKAGETCIQNLTVEPSASKLVDCMNAMVMSGENVLVKAGVDNDIRYRVWGVEMDI